MATDPAAGALVTQIGDRVRADHARWSAALGDLVAAVLDDVTDAAAPRRTTLTSTGREAREVLASHPDTFGAGFVASPDAFADGAGLVWWTRGADASELQPLDVDADFYAYTTAPWWTAALAAPGTCTTGPYVDASGTNEHIVTLSERVGSAGGPIGVVALDIRVAEIQGRLQALLAGLPAGTCVTNRTGAVLATNTGSLVGRRRHPARPNGGVIPLDPAPWLLVVGPERAEGRPGLGGAHQRTRR